MLLGMKQQSLFPSLKLLFNVSCPLHARLL